GSNITMKIDNKDLIVTAPPAPRTQGQPGGGVSFSGTGQPPQGFRAGGSSLSISNYRTGGNFNTWPNLNSIGFACRPGDEVLFSDFKVLASGRADTKNNVLFGREAGATYAIFKNLPGVTVTADGIINVKNNTDRTIVGYADPSHGSLTMLRTEFSTKAGRKPVRAKMYVTSMGSCEVFINGKRMGEDWFIPGSTQFRETIGYYAYDVTSMIKQGENCIGALLSPGWYTGYMTFTVDNYNFFGDTEALLAKLVITYDDGTRDVVTTRPEKWKVWKNGPVEYGSFFQGERYNAKKEAGISVNGNVNGWSTCEYDDSRWAQAETVTPREWIKPGIVARFDQPVRVAEVLTARRVMPVHSDDNHTFTYDMGVNMVGVPSITVPAGWLKEGDVVIMRYGEQLYPGLEGDEQEYIDLYGYTGKGKGVAGRILTETYRAALATDFYTAKGSGEVVIQPHTTYRGYQYIQITIPGHTGPLPVENVKGLVLSSGPVPDGTYEAVTADGRTGELVNRLFKNIQRSQLGNFFTIPTDCPQRNERMGWTGDAQAYSRTATYNADVRNFFRQWMVALRNDQTTSGGIGSTVPSYNTAREESFPDGTTWAGAVCMVPWQLYTQYGDLQTVQENMPAMKAWLEGMARFPFSDEYPHLSARTTGLADWLAVDRNTPSDLVNNAIYIYLMEVTAVMADAVGDREYAEVLRQRHSLAKEEWNKCYVDPATGKTRNSKGGLVHSQTSYATPLNFNTFSDSNLKKAQDYLAELAVNPSASGDGKNQYPSCSITTGFSGTPNILPALSRAGKVNEAYCMFTCTEYASWLYPVIKGATSVWERWNGYEMAFRNGGDNSMNSFNHFALGAAGQWMYEFQLGITTDHRKGEAGYKHFVLQPSAGKGFTSLKGSYNSLYGRISSSWTADGNGNMASYSATVPANTSATLYLPVSESAEEFLQVKGAVFKGKGFRNNIEVAIYELESGSFRFTITKKGVKAESF
ncbi:MAG: family 78 glycoside hydrolase catalytic domain, partial [Bacteroidales bacterium]|nr:family 78 glycoside hydrolase catalytic domain [Bacteroidales bacterium]